MGLVISKRHRPDSPFASQCHSIVLQPRLPVSPLLSASTHTRSTLQGFRSRIAPQTALSLSLSPPLSPFPRDCTLHHCTVGPLASVSSSFLGDTELEPKSGAPTDRAFLRGPLPPTRFIARRPDAARRAERGRVTVSRADFSLEPSRSRRGNLLLFNLGRRVILRNCVE